MHEYQQTPREAQSVLDFLTSINASLLGHRGRVEGEVTSVKDSYQTAIYFSIKDLEKDALLNCVIWRTTYNQNGVRIKEGDKIIVTGVPEIYAARGSFSMKVQTIEYAGEGALKKSYDELKGKLEREGLLAVSRKRPLPDYPKKIGVITSRSGVVIQDFNSNLGRYGFAITMVDSRVEGKDAIHELLAALRTMAKQDIEVLVIMRGGGSWESLQPFNTESVVRAIAEFKCPVLTGIGHDVDVTLAELVADVGASTPTAVAETLNETWDTLTSTLTILENQVRTTYKQVLSRTSRTIEQTEATVLRRFDSQIAAATRTLGRVSQDVKDAYRGLEKTINKGNQAFAKVVSSFENELKTLRTRINSASMAIPRQFMSRMRQTEKAIGENMTSVRAEEGRALRQYGERLKTIEQAIKIHDPERNLRLGYSLSYVNGTLVRSVRDLTVGSEAEIRLHDGSFTSEIKQIQ